MGGEPARVITPCNCPRHHWYVFVAGPVSAHIACPGGPRQPALLEQP